ncbi:MAG TPA: methionine--tRNA ligase subunit beta, partial [Bacteroidota bacterium]|nr:methionine--tRNA ligase subunit beta [Bacteroidota bacterium]
TTINICLQIVRSLGLLFMPVTPFASAKIRSMLNLPGSFTDDGWSSAGQFLLTEGHVLGTPEILFTKIEDSVIDAELDKLAKESAPTPVPEKKPMAPIKPQVQFEDFQKIDLRVAKVLACEAVPKSKKLLRLKVLVGEEERQIVAGIAANRKPEDLVGTSIIVVANLAPASLMGVESQGMLLAANGVNGEFALLTVTNDVPPGSGIK